MSSLHPDDFDSFFHAVHGYPPFSWQQRLVRRIQDLRAWPTVIDLPTASGKTSCLDVAIFTLASFAGDPPATRPAPRRIWFVVDRRIVVDEAFERARTLAAALASSEAAPVRAVADRLLAIGGTDRPLSVARLRGGVLRDDGWARIPSQPLIVTSTVDQVGSRMLFRAYGASNQTASIYAGLVAYDSLVIIDEAHCAEPFVATSGAVRAYVTPPWSDGALAPPLQVVRMSATSRPSPSDRREEIFPRVAERDELLADPPLQPRLHASKRITIPDPIRGAEPELAAGAARLALQYLAAGRQRVAVIVNRVATAAAIARDLHARHGSFDVVLLTGRMRPIDRDALVDRWKPYLRARDPERPPRPIVTVATQCLEVGADWSFDAMVSECASLDALRQRFGRLARLGVPRDAEGAILIGRAPAKDSSDDPVYGSALSQTWQRLRTLAADGVIDFGVGAFANHERELSSSMNDLLAAAVEPPTLLPAHLDALCQTSPTPTAEPDPTLFLHGTGIRAPDVRVVWRRDLSETRTGSWAEAVGLLPPLAREALSAPIFRVRAWLGDDASLVEEEAESDVEIGTFVDNGRKPVRASRRSRPFLVYRGRGRSFVSADPPDVRPGDFVVVPASYGLPAALGHPPAFDGDWEPMGSTDRSVDDVAERAYLESRNTAALRLQRTALAAWGRSPRVAALLRLSDEAAVTQSEVRDAIRGAEEQPAEETLPLPSWLAAVLDHLESGGGRWRISPHPDGGHVVTAALPRSSTRVTLVEEEPFAEEDEQRSDTAGAHVRTASVTETLADHTRRVRTAVGLLAGRCLPAEWLPSLDRAALLHDLGKLDPRFQLLLHGGDERRLWTGEPLAKAPHIAGLADLLAEREDDLRYPRGFRHEMVTLEIVRSGGWPAGDGMVDSDLVLHLVASHHGHARPLAPVCEDADPPAIEQERLGRDLPERTRLSAAERAASTPAHRLDSGVAERFWRLTRRFGWWGLAYVEAVFRLSDWYASEHPLVASERRRDA